MIRGGMRPQAEGNRQPPEAGGGEETASPWGLRRSQPCRHLDSSPGKLILDFWPPELKGINVCCFKLLGSWKFVTAAAGNKCRCMI